MRSTVGSWKLLELIEYNSSYEPRLQKKVMMVPQVFESVGDIKDTPMVFYFFHLCKRECLFQPFYRICGRPKQTLFHPSWWPTIANRLVCTIGQQVINLYQKTGDVHLEWKSQLSPSLCSQYILVCRKHFFPSED